MRLSALAVTIIAILSFAGCRTSASFMLPPDTTLLINDERITFEGKDEAGRPKYVRTPFFWTSIMGINYAILQGEKVVKKDRLPSEFRVASIFWPPYALFYWPVGFRHDCYDLSNPKKEFIEQCPKDNGSIKGTEQPAAQTGK